jgi:hypothetical protein
VLLLHTRQFALVNLGLAIVWLVLAGFVGARYVRMTRDAVPAPGPRQSAAGG